MGRSYMSSYSQHSQSSSFLAPVPVKLTVKKFIGDDWMIACMVPKGNMMHCMVRETGGELKQIKYNITAKELPVEIMETEGMLADFFEAGITDIKREGENLRITSGGKDLVWT